ncbi:UDP-N-acetylmuramoyl-L-alanine--D-glutamate ligase, partial [Candidatus Fermentibacterales bacterium]|nr:UDP-N-acetylmuramoyl-L-alanine--D-glutamate ligase [Candidatus Fermentibacterales bacterium]
MGYWTEGQDKRVGVVGLERSGRAAVRLLAGKGFSVVGMDSKESVPGCEACDVVLRGPHDPAVLDGLDGLVISPGVDPRSAFVTAARELGIPVIGELELGFLSSDATFVAVTGSNGKTTTVTWLAHLLKRAGVNAVLAGNVGVALCDAILDQPDAELIVVEVSSYQLQTIERFRPRAGAVLNVSPDHLARHGSMDHYTRAKARLFENQHSEDVIFLNGDDPGSKPLFGLTKGSERHFSVDGTVRAGVDCGGGGPAGDIAIVEDDGSRTRVLGCRDVSLPGLHNLSNALAVTGLAHSAGLGPEAIAAGLSSFAGVPHRIERVRVLDGVTWINDSKATNQESLRVALESQKSPVILIAGGLSKGSDYSELAGLISSRVKRLILLGAAAGELEEAWRGSAPIERASSMEEAVLLARRASGSGDVVMLSPACASFDMYRDFEERGEHFRALVEALR